MYPDSISGWQKDIRKKSSRHQPGGYINGLMEGSVEISFIIDSTGIATKAAIAKKSGYIDLDQRALTIIEKSRRWIPAILDNHSVSSTQKQTMRIKG